MSKEKIIEKLESLTKEEGFLYSLSILLVKDFFLNPEEYIDVKWKEKLSFQEASFLIGLMVKHKIDLSVVPEQKKTIY